MRIIDKLDKKISKKVNENELKEDERLKEGKKFFDFWGEVYKKHLAKDFIRLEKLLKKYLKKDNRAIVEITNCRVRCGFSCCCKIRKQKLRHAMFRLSGMQYMQRHQRRYICHWDSFDRQIAPYPNRYRGCIG